VSIAIVLLVSKLNKSRLWDLTPSKCIRESLSTSKVIIVWVTSTIVTHRPQIWCTFGVGNYLITDR